METEVVVVEEELVEVHLEQQIVTAVIMAVIIPPIPPWLRQILGSILERRLGGVDGTGL